MRDLSRAFIDGQWVMTPRSYAVRNPTTNHVIGDVADCGEAEATRAIDASVASFESWRKETAYTRARVLQRWNELILDHEEELARVMTDEMGKPIRESRGEVKYAAGFVSWFAQEAMRIYGETIPSQFAHKRLIVHKQAIGPVVAITPWNFPAAMVTRKAAPALAVGCTVILKPAEQTPTTALFLGQLWEEAGGPSGTLQVLPTNDPQTLGNALLNDQRIRKLTFTGSTEIGKVLYRASADTLKRVSLELGGHAPFLIFEDANLDKAVQEVVACKFRNAGQTCVCTNRIYVQDPIKDVFAEKFTQAVRQLRMGDPREDGTDIGPLVDQQGLLKVQEHVADALNTGAELLTGGRVHEGLYYEPTVLIDLGNDARMLTEETFGPVAPIMSFHDESEAVRRANDTDYGLAAYLWTENLGRAFRVSEALNFGVVGINDGVPSTPQAPFGGVKNSGQGREGGKWGIEEYLDVKYISLSLD